MAVLSSPSVVRRTDKHGASEHRHHGERPEEEERLCWVYTKLCHPAAGPKTTLYVEHDIFGGATKL
jgi:hypothetical protein